MSNIFFQKNYTRKIQKQNPNESCYLIDTAIDKTVK